MGYGEGIFLGLERRDVRAWRWAVISSGELGPRMGVCWGKDARGMRWTRREAGGVLARLGSSSARSPDLEALRGVAASIHE